MKKAWLAFLTATALCYGTLSQAADESFLDPPPLSFGKNQSNLDDRFNQCIINPECPAPFRIQIIQEESDKMNLLLQEIHRACANASLHDCLDLQRENILEWGAANDSMQKMMQSMEAQTLEKKEPAAGKPEKSASRGRTLWDKIWWYSN